MQVSFDDFQEALVDGRINMHQFLEVLVDNFGQKRAMEIIQKNLEIAKEKYDKDIQNDDVISNISDNFMYN